MHSVSMPSLRVQWIFRTFPMIISIVELKFRLVSHWLITIVVVFINLIYNLWLTYTVIYNQTQLRLVWNRFEASTAEYPRFKIRFWYTSTECELWENPIPENSCITGTLKLVRRLSYYIIRYYLTTFLTVCISYVHLWVPINAWTARVSENRKRERERESERVLMLYF